MARLGDIFVITSGGTPNRKKNEYYDNGTVPWVKTGDLKEKYVPFEVDCITEEGVKNSSAKRFPIGTVLVAMYGATIGACSILPYEATTNQACAAFLPNASVQSDFLYYFLCSKKEQFIKDGVGGAQPNISASYLKKVEMFVPSFEEQRKIVESLDGVDSLLFLRKQQLAKLDELVKARFVELFGDPILDDGRYPKVPLGALAEISSSKRIFEREYVSEGVPFYRTKEIVELSKGNCITTELFIARNRYDEIRNEYGVPQKGDLLISAVGTIGVIWIVDGKNDFYFKDGNLLRVAVTEKFAPIYLKHLLEALIGAYKQEMSSGTAYAALTISALKGMLVYEVPVAEQEQLAAFVKQTDKSKFAVQQSIEKLETLKKSLMQQYFG